MRIKEITYRHRNDFHFIAQCEHCGHETKYTDGYADDFYCLRVIPEGCFCPECDRNSYGQKQAVKQAAAIAKEK